MVQRELRALPHIVSILERMSQGRFEEFHVTKSHNELDQVQSSLQKLQASVATIVNESGKRMNTLKEQQTIIESLIKNTNENAHSGFKDLELVATTELHATASEVSSSAAHADKRAQETMRVVNEGAQVLQDTDVINRSVSQAISESALIINELRDYSKEISSVVEVINSISEQTNLLALNAAIGAARAGQHGRGFAVVADEVRSLAQRTQASTVDIRNIIMQLQSQSQKADEYMTSNTELVQHSQAMMQALSKAFEGIREQVMNISQMNAQVSIASDEQRTVTQDITERISDINNTVRHSVDSAQQTEEANDMISSQTNDLQRVLAFFNVEGADISCVIHRDGFNFLN